jgi:hypothetical protein
MKSLYKFFLVSLPIIINTLSLEAQTETESATKLSPKEFSIPASPVFDMMGVTPSQINKTSDIKDFKVDWSFKSYKVSPNLAIESQPFWEIFYNRKPISKYQQASKFMRFLSSTDFSLGTVQNENAERRMGYAVKMSLFKSKDPLLDGEIYEGIDEKFTSEKEELIKKITEINIKLDSSKNILERPSIKQELRQTEESLLGIETRRRQEINDRAKVFIAEYWNSSYVDMAFGKVNTYQTDSIGSLKSLKLNRNTGLSGWLNGGIGAGKRLFISSLIRGSWYEEELNFNLMNSTTQEITTEEAIASNTLLTLGLNIRYGGPVYNFFAEFFHERKGIKTASEALSRVFSTPQGMSLISSSVKWDIVHPYVLAIGGDWRISRSVAINYGLRATFDKKWTLNSLTPLVSIACMMR